MKNRICGIALLLWGLVLPSRTGAVARASGSTDCPSSPACLSLFQQARQQSGQGNLEEAVRLYRAAYELRADPGLLFNIARVMHKQGQSETAVAYYEQFLSSASEDVAQKHKAQTFLEQLLRPDGSRPSPPPPVRPQTPILSPESSSNVIHTTTPLIRTFPAALTEAAVAAPPPTYKRWWLWTIVGGTVAASAVGLGVGLAFQSRSLPSGINTYQPVF